LAQRTRVSRRLRVAATLQLVQGVAMEGLAFLGLLVLLTLGIDQATVTDRAHVFALPYLQDNLYLMMAISGVFAALRVIGAIGVLRNRMWGLVLCTTTCVLTLALMTFMLPAGIVDGVLSGGAFVLILLARYGAAPIEGRRAPAGEPTPS